MAIASFMQVSCGHEASIQVERTEGMVFLAENDFRSDLRVYNFSWQEHAQVP